MTFTIHDQIADEIDDTLSSEERRIGRVEMLADDLALGDKTRLRNFLVAVIEEDGIDSPETINKLAERGAELRGAL